MKRKNGKIILAVSALFIIIIFFKMEQDLKDIKFLNSGEHFRGFFIDSIYEQLKFNHGSIDNEDTLCSFSINDTLHILVWKIKGFSVKPESIFIVEQRNILNFYFVPYDVIELTGNCKISKKRFKEIKSEIELKIENDENLPYLYHNNVKFTTSKFSIGYKGDRPTIIFDFDEINDIEFYIKDFNNYAIVFMLYANKNEKVNLCLSNIFKDID